MIIKNKQIWVSSVRLPDPHRDTSALLYVLYGNRSPGGEVFAATGKW